MNFGTNGCMYNCGDSCTGECIEPIKPINSIIKRSENDHIEKTYFQDERNDYDDNKSKSGQNYLTIQYEKLVPLLIEGMKEQQCIICSQSQKIALLESCIGIV